MGDVDKEGDLFGRGTGVVNAARVEVEPLFILRSLPRHGRGESERERVAAVAFPS